MTFILASCHNEKVFIKVFVKILFKKIKNHKEKMDDNNVPDLTY